MDSGWSLKTAAPADRRPRRPTANRRGRRPSCYARDPYNRLLARGPRFRVEAEIVRDIALAASGLLNPKSAGPASIPPRRRSCSCRRPAMGPRSGTRTTGPDRYRRALYTFRYRSVPYPMLQTFDAPNGDFSCVRRVALEHAAAGADDAERADVPRVRPGAGAADARARAGRPMRDRLVYAFRRCLARAPTEPETATLLRSAAAEQTGDSPRPDAEPVGAGGRRPEPSRRSCRPARRRPSSPAWTAVSRVLLNLDETITKE